MLGNWERLLTSTVGDEDAFRKAFRTTLARHPEAIECARTGGLLAAVMRRELPTLAREAPEAIDALIQDVVAGFLQATAAEFEAYVRETGVEGKLADLEKREAQLKASRADADSESPAPLALQPEEEMRSVAVEALLAHEAQLQKELERVRVEDVCVLQPPRSCLFVPALASRHPCPTLPPPCPPCAATACAATSRNVQLGGGGGAAQRALKGRERGQ